MTVTRRKAVAKMRVRGCFERQLMTVRTKKKATQVTRVEERGRGEEIGRDGKQ